MDIHVIRELNVRGERRAKEQSELLETVVSKEK